MNTVANRESRSKRDRCDWKLDAYIFRRIDEIFGSRLTYQCCSYFSWRPNPFAEATDGFLPDWSSLSGFANPPGT